MRSTLCSRLVRCRLAWADRATSSIWTRYPEVAVPFKHRPFCTSRVNPPSTKVCIVGSGPGGFYTAQKLLKEMDSPKVRGGGVKSGELKAPVDEGSTADSMSFTIDILERLPVPYGLVRYGVAPDHPEVKNVISHFRKVCEHPSVQFLGNVEVGRDITVKELKRIYDVIVFSYGASAERELGSSFTGGNEIANYLPARHFVSWYNGHPDFRNLAPSLSGGKSKTAVIIGQGNVAMDCARVLLSDTKHLQCTDITSYALNALRKSDIETVILAGRRGPLQAAFTIKEFREMTKIKDCNIVVDQNCLKLSQEERDIVEKSRPKKRLFDLVTKSSMGKRSGDGGKTFELGFFLNPISIEKDPVSGDICAVKFEETALEGPLDARTVRGTGKMISIPCDLVLSSIGYKSVSIEGVPFDYNSNTIPNSFGRILSDANAKEEETSPCRLYCSGWVKRGPKGVILQTMNDGFETAESIIEDIKTGKVKSTSNNDGSAFGSLRKKGVQVVDFAGWKRIESKEFHMGAINDKCAKKLTSVDEMIAIASEKE
eukprot:Nk52_evm14s2462 gene=Nk52_evmTU14s2462